MTTLPQTCVDFMHCWYSMVTAYHINFVSAVVLLFTFQFFNKQFVVVLAGFSSLLSWIQIKLSSITHVGSMRGLKHARNHLSGVWGHQGKITSSPWHLSLHFLPLYWQCGKSQPCTSVCVIEGRHTCMSICMWKPARASGIILMCFHLDIWERVLAWSSPFQLS